MPAFAANIDIGNPLFWDPYNPAISPLDVFEWPLGIFTNNGNYADDPGVDLRFELSNGNENANFTFWNDSTVQSSMTRIFFDDGSLLGMATITEIPLDPAQEIIVDFSEEATPSNLPGANLLDPPFNAIRDFNSSAVPPLFHNGVNNGGVEWLTLSFDLLQGQSYLDVQNELISFTLRVGVHVQGFADGSSESAVSIPEPATLALLAIGGLVVLRRRRR